MKKTYLFLLFCVLCVSGAFAQTIINGTVVSKSDGLPIPGATIIPNNNTSLGIATDFDGNFTINVAEVNGTITVSSIGFVTQEMTYEGSTTLNVQLVESLNSLEEIVLIGYGSAKKGDLTTGVATVENVEDIATRPVSNLSDFLQGNLPGVTISQDGGDPSASANIKIRGTGTLSNEAPLYIVDGMPYYGPAINPNDIASVSVLKDAASASIYGAQAASGVIVIETKKGRKGVMRVSIDSYAGFQSANNLPTALNAEQNNLVYNTAADNAGVPRVSAHDPVQNPWGAVTRTNWMDEITRDAALYNVNATVSGGGDKGNYLTSFGYNKVDGILVGTSKDRYSFRVKSDYKITDKLTVGENVYFTRDEAVGANTTSGYSGAIINAIYMPAAAQVYNEDGTFQGVVPQEQANFAGAYGDVYNPVALLLRPSVSNPVNYINANAYLKYEIIKGLNFKSSYSYAITDAKSKTFQPRVPEIGRSNDQNYLYQSFTTDNSWIWDNQVNYNASFGVHNIDVTAVYTAQNSKYEYYYQEGQGFSSEDGFNQYMGNASTLMQPVTDANETSLTSAIARVMYNYDHRYYVSGSFRRDETSRLASSNQADNFSSVAGAWRISNESFFNVKPVNDLKLRASWGQIGNISSVSPYAFDVPLGSNTNVMGADGTYNAIGYFAQQQSNPDLLWETSESVDVGLDAKLFDNHVSLTVDYFNKKTKGMIMADASDPHIGVAPKLINAGDVENKGWEFAASYSGGKKDFSYSVFANAALIDNKLLNLDGYSGSVDYINDNTSIRGVIAPFRNGVGQELNSYFLVPQEGIFQSQDEINAYTHNGALIQPNAQPGDLKFTDTNNDGRIDSNDRVFKGSYQPDVTYSFGFNFDYKNFDLKAMFQGVAGVKAFNAYKYTTYNASLQGYNLDNRVLNAWSPENTSSNIPRVSTNDANMNFGTASTWYLEDASYLRLKNITLGYTLPTNVMNSIFEGSTLRVYISADNVFTITDYEGMDPEVGNRGLDMGRYPLSSRYVAGVSLSF